MTGPQVDKINTTYEIMQFVQFEWLSNRNRKKTVVILLYYNVIRETSFELNVFFDYHYGNYVKSETKTPTFFSGKPKIPDSSGNTIKKLLLCFKWETLGCANRLHYPFGVKAFDWLVNGYSCMTKRSNLTT